MWVRRDDHALCLRGWAEVVGEGPRSDHSLSSIRQRATNFDSRAGRNLDEAWLEQHF
jgi:hypothetical protein